MVCGYELEATPKKAPPACLLVVAERLDIEQSFKDTKSRLGLARVRAGCAKRLSRLLMALSIAALSWRAL